jgi:hypothetical protein
VIDSRAPTQGGLTGVRELLRVVNRRKIIILAPTVLVAGIAWLIASVTVPRFTAIAAVTLGVGKVHLVDREIVTRLPLESSTLRSEIDIHALLFAERGGCRFQLWLDPICGGAGGTRHGFVVARVVLRMRDALIRVSLVLRRLWGSLRRRRATARPILTRAQLVDWLIDNLTVTNAVAPLLIVVSSLRRARAAAKIANAVAPEPTWTTRS